MDIDALTPEQREEVQCWYFRRHLGRLRRAAWARILTYKRLPHPSEADHLLSLYYDERFLSEMHRTFGSGRKWVIEMVRAKQSTIQPR